jgi:glycerol-1-phosphate dehydrogenase [NAD(P)+]
MALLVRELLARLEPGGVLPCSCGRSHRLRAADVLVEAGALDRAADLLDRRHPAGAALWVLSDENTEEAAGARWKSAVRGRVHSRVLPAAPRPLPSLELAGELAAEVRGAAPDLLVAVGGGVVSDLVKKVSLDVDLPSWCIATAPSVDAYTSATASLRVAGYHQTTAARMSDVIICDLDVLSRAPRPLLLAGLGDLVAKLVAVLDWNVAHLVTGEHVCQAIADLSLAAARAAVVAARTLDDDTAAAAAALTDAVLVSGFAMQAAGGSRPAASAEHTIAHFWETTSAVAHEELDLHGILVGAATAMVLRGYRHFYGRLDAAIDVDAIASAHAARPSWTESLEPAMRPFAGKIAGEMRHRSIDGAVLAARVAAFGARRERIAGLAAPLLAELEQAIEHLGRLGFPLSPSELGIPEPLRMLPVRNVRLLRDRYTTFDLAHELGRAGELIDAVAAE